MNTAESPQRSAQPLPDRRAMLAAVSGLAAGTLIASRAAAGPLNPPAGPVTSTGKTLTEVEPRVAVNTVNTPGDATHQFLITQPGSYYLTGNLSGVSGRNGIGIAADNVTLDLNGFTLTGVPGALAGIKAASAAQRATVRNGKLPGWPGGGVSVQHNSTVEAIDAGDAGSVAILAGDNAIVRGCHVTGGPAEGIFTGPRSLVSECVVEGTGGVGINCISARISGCQVAGCNGGIRGGDRSHIDHCRAAGNTNYGIQTGSDCLVIDCVSDASGTNFLTGSRTVLECCAAAFGTRGFSVALSCVLSRCVAGNATVAGFEFSDRCVLSECAASACLDGFVGQDANTLVNCRADQNSGDGFRVRFGNALRGCGARLNAVDGIESGSGGHIVECHLDSNGNGSVGANIRLTGNVARVEANSLVGADFGIHAAVPGNIILRNSSGACPNHYGAVVANNTMGPVVTSGTISTNSNPHANYAY